MAAMTALLILAAAPAGAPADQAARFHPKTGATASALATVRIISGASIRFGGHDDQHEYPITKASVRIEDGSLRPAQLVEFQ